MRIKRMLGPALIMAILITSIPVAFANGEDEPGYSPGYWKHQLKVMIRGRGHLHETHLDALLTDIGLSLEVAYALFTTGNNSDGAWTDLANLFNTAAGREPYIE